MSELRNVKDASFDLSTTVNSQSIKSTDECLNNKSNVDQINELKSTDHSLTDHQKKKSKSFTKLIRNKFKSKSKLKSKELKEPKSMVRSISIAFTSDDHAASHKQVRKSISNLYLDNQDDSRSTNLNDDSRSTNDCKKSKLKKLGEKLRIKFKFRSNSLDDRSTDLDDSLEQQESDVFDKSDKDLASSNDDTQTNMQLIDKLGYQCDQIDYSDEIETQDYRLKNEISDSVLLNKMPKSNAKLRPKSEIYLGAGNQMNSNLKNQRFSTIENFQNLGFGKLESYKKQKLIGMGSYAIVYRGYTNLFDKVVALKEISLQKEEGTPFTAIREASLLKRLKHANIVTLHDIIHTKQSLTFVFEYVEVDLNQYMEKLNGNGINPFNCKLFLFQLFRGLAYIHDRKILHRDLKPQNLLISKIGELKLCDFGLAREVSVPSKTFSNEVVTLWYRPPELLLGLVEYSCSLDIWGCGCIFIEMLQGSSPFNGAKDASSQLCKIFSVFGGPTEETWPNISNYPYYEPEKWIYYERRDIKTVFRELAEDPNAEDLSLNMLSLRPEFRISSRDAMKHNYFKSLPKMIFKLPDNASIFEIPGLQLKPEVVASKRSTSIDCESGD